MAYDVGVEAVAVLEAGLLPELPTLVEPGKTFPVAFDVWDDVGAVMFFRRWRDGAHDMETAICERIDGEWEHPPAHGGAAGGSFDELYRVPPPSQGWNGSPVLWFGSSGRGVGDDEHERDVIAIEGLAAPPVVWIEVVGRNLTRRVPVASACGAFVVLAQDEGRLKAWALDEAGVRVSGADGRPLGWRSRD